MYLLNHAQILKAVRTKNSDLEIGNFEKKCLQHTVYYFRLGSPYEYRNDRGEWTPRRLDAEHPLKLEAGEAVRIESRESFRLGDRVLGMLGGTSSLARDGLLLLHGPFIDPLFPDKDIAGRLEMGLVNQTGYPIDVPFEAQIGKVAFFDVSDTYPVELEHGSRSEELFEQRRDR